MGNDITYRFTVIVAIHGVAKYLDKCLKSLQNQAKFTNYEVLMMLDAATEEDKEVVSKFKDLPNFKMIEVNFRNQSFVRNEGIKLAKGEYIYFVDGDDYLSELALYNFDQALKDKDYDIVISNYYLDNNGKIRNPILKPNKLMKYDNKTKNAKRIIADFFFRGYVWNKVYKREFLLKHNLSFLNVNVFIEDSIFNYYCYALTNRIKFISSYNYYYGNRPDSCLHLKACNFVKQYTNSLALMRYSSSQMNLLESTNIWFFYKKIMMLWFTYLGTKQTKTSFRKNAKTVIKKINNIKKLNFDNFLLDEDFFEGVKVFESYKF